MYCPRRPRSSSDTLSTSFNGELLDSRQHCNSDDNLDPTEDSDVDNGPLCVPALISPPCSAGEDVDLSPPDIGMATLDFDPMSFQCSLTDTPYTFTIDDLPAGVEGSTLKSPSSICCQTNGSDLISTTFVGGSTSAVFSTEVRVAAEDRVENKKVATSFSCIEKPTQTVSPIKCGKTGSLTPFTTQVPFSSEIPPQNTVAEAVCLQLLSAPSAASGSPSLMGSVLLRATEPLLSEVFQVEVHSAFDSVDSLKLKGVDSTKQATAATCQEDKGR